MNKINGLLFSIMLLGACYTATVAGAGEITEQFAQMTILSAEQGDAEAQFRLGMMYYHGNRVEQDDVQAAYWFRQAAEQGYADAQLKLGDVYEYGKGVEQDYTQAIYWYRQAAEQEHAGAQFYLGRMYKLGRGVQRDLSLASEWYARSCDNGSYDSCDAYRELNSQDAQ